MQWADWMSFILGLWLSVAPFVLGHGKVGGAIYTDMMPGAVIATFALLRALGREMEGMADLSWVVAGGGFWVLLAPLIVGYSETRAAVANDVSVGLVVSILGTWRAVSCTQGERVHVEGIQERSVSRAAEVRGATPFDLATRSHGGAVSLLSRGSTASLRREKGKGHASERHHDN